MDADNFFGDDATLLVGILTGVLATLLGTLAWVLLSKFWNIITLVTAKIFSKLGQIPFLRFLGLKAYRQSIRRQYGHVINIYLDREESLDLNQVFVPLTLLQHNSSPSGDRDQHTTREVLTNHNQRRLIILGAPGSGKTTMLKSLATGVSRRQWAEFSDYFPIFISLRSYSQHSTDYSLFDWMAKKLLPSHGLLNSVKLLRRFLNEGKVLLLLDGLDEVNSEELSRTVSQIVDCLRDSDLKRSCRVIVTCREQNYNLLEDPGVFLRAGFAEYRLSDMRDSEVEAMVLNRTEDFRKREKSTQEFLTKIFTNSQIQHLHRNPLLLTISMGLYLNRLEDTVPHDLAAFYQESIEHLLRRHDFRDSRDVTKRNRFDPIDKADLLKKFALNRLIESTSQNEDFEDFSITSMVETAEALARDRLNIQKSDAEELVKEIHRNAGLIKDVGDREHFTYAHRSIHEFCAAQHLSSLGQEGFQILCRYLNLPNWRQIITFYSSLENQHVEELITVLLNYSSQGSISQSISMLTLAGDCAAVLRRPNVPLRLKVVKHLSENIQSSEGHLRQAVLVSLLNLGRDGPVEVKSEVEKVLKEVIDIGNIHHIAKEFGRIGANAAIPLLEFLASGSDPGRKVAALIGASHIHSIEKIGVLWQLIGEFHNSGDTNRKDEALIQLLDLMEKDNAVKKLNFQRPIFTGFDVSTIKRIFPFHMDRPKPKNFETLLAIEADRAGRWGNCEDWRNQKTDWMKFLVAATRPKTSVDQKHWINLPRDRTRNPELFSIPSLYPVGRFLYGFGVFVGIVGLVISWFIAGIIGSELLGIIMPAPLAFLLAFIVTIVILTFLGSYFSKVIGQKMFFRWWEYGTKRGWISDFGALPRKMLIYYGIQSKEISKDVDLPEESLPAYFFGHLFFAVFVVAFLTLGPLLLVLSFIDLGNSSQISGVWEILIITSTLIWIMLNWTLLIGLTFALPSTRIFDQNKRIYLRTPNPYLPLYDLPKIEQWMD